MVIEKRKQKIIRVLIIWKLNPFEIAALFAEYGFLEKICGVAFIAKIFSKNKN
jgi:hypothetical protein